jgi:hypothetical protein
VVKWLSGGFAAEVAAARPKVFGEDQSSVFAGTWESETPMRTKRAGLVEGAGMERVLSPSAVAFAEVTAL